MINRTALKGWMTKRGEKSHLGMKNNSNIYCILTMWLFLVGVCFAQKDLVLSASEGIPEEGCWVEIYITVGSLSLARAATVVVPNGTVCKIKKTVQNGLKICHVFDLVMCLIFKEHP